MSRRVITQAEDLGDGLIALTVRNAARTTIPSTGLIIEDRDARGRLRPTEAAQTERWSLVFHAGQWEVRAANDVLYDRCPGVGRALDALLSGEYDGGPLV